MFRRKMMCKIILGNKIEIKQSTSQETILNYKKKNESIVTA